MRAWTGIALSLSLIALFAGAASAQDAATIVKEATDKNSTGFQTGAVQMTLTTQDKSGASKVRRLSARSKRAEEGQRTLVRLLSPNEVKGQSFLFKEVQNGEDLVYWYLPAFSVTRRIQGEGKKGSFMGTHITYADLESRDVKTSHYKKLPDEKIGKIDVHVIEATPKHKKESEYGKVVLYIRKSDNTTLKMRFFDKKGAESKVLFVEKLDRQGEQLYVKQMTVRPKEGGFTRMAVDSIELGKEIPDALFTPEALANE